MSIAILEKHIIAIMLMLLMLHICVKQPAGILTLRGRIVMRARDKIKQTLIELLKTTPADQLAVKTLIIEANISKQTLYNNYYGILDAVCEVVCNLFDQASEKYFGQENWMTGMLEALRMLDANKEVMMHLWNSNWRYDILTALADHVYPIIMDGINECEEKNGLSVPEEDKKTVACLYQDIFMGMIMRYMHRRMDMDPEELLNVYGAVLEKNTAYGLRRICERSGAQNE